MEACYKPPAILENTKNVELQKDSKTKTVTGLTDAEWHKLSCTEINHIGQTLQKSRVVQHLKD